MTVKIKHKKTYQAKTGTVQRKWYLVNAEDQVLGRLATKVADLLRGKGKVDYTPHVDSGDFVIIINAEKIKSTGNKITDKIYNFISGYSSGVLALSQADLLKRNPTKVVMEAVRGMLPHNRLGRKQLTKCKVFKGAEHTHQAQKPVEIKL